MNAADALKKSGLPALSGMLGPKSAADVESAANELLRCARMTPGGGSQYPRLIPVLVRSMITGSARERDRNIDAGVIDLYLDLNMKGVSLLDFDQAATVTEAGYEAASPQIEAWLKQSKGEGTTV